MRKTLLGDQLFGVGVLGILWSAQPAIVKYSALSDDSPTAFLLSASAIVAGLLSLYSIGTGKSVASVLTEWRFYQASALLGFFLPLLTRVFISDAVPLYVLTVAVALTPAFVALLSKFYLKKNLHWITGLAVILGISGTLLAVFPEMTGDDIALRMKTLAVLLIPVSYAINQVFIYNAYPENLSSIQVAAGESAHTLLMATIFSVIAYSAGGVSDLKGTLMFSPAVMLWGTITALETVAFFWFSKRVTPLSVSIAIYAAIGFGVLWGWLFFDENVSVTAVVGVGLIVLSAAAIAYQDNRKMSSDTPAVVGPA